MSINFHRLYTHCALGLGLIGGTIQFASTCWADWPQFRGPNAGSVALTAKLPTKFGGESKENVLWQTKLPGRSVGGAIVVGNQVITTSSSGMDQRRLHLVSLNDKDGSIRWQQEWVARGRPFCHPTSANAAPTPVSDGKFVYAFYSSNDIACVDLDGNLVWYRSLSTDFPKAGNDVGMSSSPIVVDGVCVVQVECQGDSFAAGLSCDDGRILWKSDRPKQANWASPLALKLTSGEQAVVMQSGQNLIAVSPKTGKPVWKLDLKCSTIPSAMAAESRLFVPASGGLSAFDLSSAGTEPSKLWDNNKLNANACSPLVVGKHVYTISRTVLACADLFSGELKWQARLGEAKSIWSSPVVAGNNLYVFSDEGKCMVVQLGDEKGTLVETNDLGESVLGSPAISGNALYVRGVSSVWKIAQK
ncbi:MAG: PQQ-binding-like beta-propeller repeat protein [Pirellula sp.]